MALPAKLGVSVITLGSLGGLSYAGSIYFSKNNEIVEQTRSIDELIKEEFKYILLDTKEGTDNKDKEQWSANWKKYTLANKSNATGNDTFKLKGWTNVGDIELIEELKKECSLLSKKNIKGKNYEPYLKVTEYCGRSVTIADEIEKLNLKTLDTKTSGQDESIWDNKVSGKEALKAHFNTLNIAFENASKESVKNGCSTASLKNKKEINYTTILESYKAVCTKSS